MDASRTFFNNYANSSDSGDYSSTSGTSTAVTNLSVTITTSGRPIMVMLVGRQNGGAYISYIGSESTTVGNSASTIIIKRNGSAVSKYILASSTTAGITTQAAVNTVFTNAGVNYQGGVRDGSYLPIGYVEGVSLSGASATTTSSYIIQPPSSVAKLDIIGAGTYTYTIEATTNGIVSFSYVSLVAYEI